MDRQQLRLELVKLTHVHGRDASEAVIRAKTLEAYVYEEPAPELPKRVVRATKQREPQSKGP